VIGARWRPALRIARRTSRRHPGRTVLVSLLVAAPVLGATFLDTAYRTASLSAEDRATRSIGAADAALEVTGLARIEPTGETYVVPPGTAERDPASVRPGPLLPPGSRLVPVGTPASVQFDAGDRKTPATGVELDTGDPMTAGLYSLREGRLPSAPGEVALAPRLAERLGAAVGDVVRPVGAPGLRVVGLAADPGCLTCRVAVGLPGWTRAAPPGPATRFLVDLPDGADPRAARDRLAASGVLLTPRDAFLHPEAWGGWGDQGGDDGLLGIALIVAGIGLLEVVLLAGTAFAVAARRQVRDVALVLSNGGRRADVRRMVLAQGLVLGLLGAGLGVVLGVAAVPAARPLLERLANQEIGGLLLSPRDLALVALVGVLSGLAAAVVPAWSAARVPVVAALAGRYGRVGRVGRRIGTAGLLVTVAGLLVAGLVSWQWAQARRAAEAAGTVETGLTWPLAMLAGFGLAMVGLTVAAPSLVAVAGRLARRLPLTGRLAVRDAARHRHRTGPAVGAVLVAVAGSVAVAVAVASYDRHDRDAYVPALPMGMAALYAGTDPRVTVNEARSAAAELPATGIVQVPGLRRGTGPDGERAYAELPAGSTYSGSSSWTVSTGPEVVALVAGDRAAEARAVLAGGRALVTEPGLVRDGTVRVSIGERVQSLPATVLEARRYSALPVVVLDEGTVRRLGLRPVVEQVLIRTSRVPTEEEEDRARSAVGEDIGYLRVERGYSAPYLPGFLALIGGAGLVTLAGVAISVSLSAAEGRADLATLAAVGAPPGRRRGLAMVQAALVAGLGAGLGVLLGSTIGLTIMGGLDGYPLVVPWTVLLVVGIGVPVLGVLIVGLATRSRLPIVRRLA
jgi:putative ABC transport system permease protein